MILRKWLIILEKLWVIGLLINKKYIKSQQLSLDFDKEEEK